MMAIWWARVLPTIRTEAGPFVPDPLVRARPYLFKRRGGLFARS
jgi:hypothetical protein